MKKLRIKDEKLFKQAIKVISMAILSIIVVVIIANYLKVNGFSGFFTADLYKGAFEKNPNDIILINRMEVSIIVCIMFMAQNELKYNKEIRDLEREEGEIC